MNAWSQRRRTGFVLTLVAFVLLVGAGAYAVARADPPSTRGKYYLVVAGADGKVETLSEIALRLLGSEQRAVELYELNEGRPQPGGATLTSGGALRAGWVLVLPWDAVGDGVRYGTVPTQKATTPKTTTPKTTTPKASTPTKTEPAQTGPPGGTPTPPVVTGSPTSTTSPATVPPSQAECAKRPAPEPAENAWAQQRMSPEDAWSAAGRGSGVVVAVVDSGVDSSVPQLAGRVSGGVDVVAGTESGTTDCLGSGTAMAALIVGVDPQRLLGVAPDATVMPVRVAVDSPTAAATDQATAIEVAVSAGARVIALGSYVDASLPGVRQAINEATRHDVVVVVAGPLADDGSLPPQVVRVGMLNADGRLAQDYPPGTIDVVAPGQDVASLGTTGQGMVQVTGSQYAVALVAGAAALLRGAAPALGADRVAFQLRETATALNTDEANQPASGGETTAMLVNPPMAVAAAAKVAGAATPRRNAVPAGSGDGTGSGPILISGAILVLLIAGGAVMLRRRQAQQAGRGSEPGEATTEDGFAPH